MSHGSCVLPRVTDGPRGQSLEGRRGWPPVCVYAASGMKHPEPSVSREAWTFEVFSAGPGFGAATAHLSGAVHQRRQRPLFEKAHPLQTQALVDLLIKSKWLLQLSVWVGLGEKSVQFELP